MNASEYKIILPFSFKLSGKDKKDYTNLNVYRNVHHFLNNKAKQEFYIAVKGLIEHLPIFHSIEIQYIVFPKTKRLFDLDNKIILAKFFHDALIKSGKIKDDNYTVIEKISLSFGGIDAENPRIEAIIINKGV